MNNGNDKLELTLQSLETELEGYKKNPFICLYEYIWNSFDAGATEVKINYTIPRFGNIEQIKIENKKHHGEKQKGLTFNIRDGKAKIYVRKWSDILNVEWEHKLRYIKEKLQIESKSIEYKSPQEVVNDTLKK